MFPKEVYWQRRKFLRDLVGEGLILFPGNEESAMNYKSNTYHFRQDSSFLYFFGINKPGFYGVCDVDSGKDTLYGDNFTMGDIIWMGDQPSVSELADGVATDTSDSLAALASVLQKAIQSGRKIHMLPAYRGDQIISLAGYMGVSCEEVSSFHSESLIGAVVKLRAVKDSYEIAEIENEFFDIC